MAIRPLPKKGLDAQVRNSANDACAGRNDQIRVRQSVIRSSWSMITLSLHSSARRGKHSPHQSECPLAATLLSARAITVRLWSDQPRRRGTPGRTNRLAMTIATSTGPAWPDWPPTQPDRRSARSQDLQEVNDKLGVATHRHGRDHETAPAQGELHHPNSTRTARSRRFRSRRLRALVFRGWRSCWTVSGTCTAPAPGRAVISRVTLSPQST